ncbi:MAG: hypothetical protein LLF89_00730 [Spirochaetaceae bacterium]|nr:hypothetical protein [Spirochaetaceae bacterium]
MIKNRKYAAFVAVVLVLFIQPATQAFAQNTSGTLDVSTPLDESSMFGEQNQLVTVIDAATAAQGVQLVEDTKTYPVFLLEGDVSAGLGGSVSDSSTLGLFGAVNLSDLSFTFTPQKDMDFNLTMSGTFMPSTDSGLSIAAQDLDVTGYADIRTSEFTRFYASASYTYNTSDSGSIYETSDGFSLDELFLDTAINRKVFFRLGKQKVSWGVGYWYKPADVLSLAAVDPDDPTADREGPFAFKTDMPFGKLNHATLYVVPPTTDSDGNLSGVSAAERTDIVVGGFELSIAGFARSDMEVKPRLMFMFSGAIGDFDIYGENVLAYGSDRIYVRKTGTGSYETYRVENTPIFQSTIGTKYSWENSDGLGVDLQVQGYYNGMGYSDSTVLFAEAAKKAVYEERYGATSKTVTSSMDSIDLQSPGMFYLAGSASVSDRFGEGSGIVNTDLSCYALFNFSDGSKRLKPDFSLTIGSGGSKLDLELSALTALGEAGSEYAPKGNKVTPALSATIMNVTTVTFGAPIYLNDDYSFKKSSYEFSLYWDILKLEK